MLLADKLIKLRKHSGKTVEELAKSLSVTPELLSKWESDAASPDVAKILEIGKLFGIPIDYLLRNDLDIEELLDDGGMLKSLSAEDAREYVDHRERFATKVSLAAFLMIFSIIPLVLFGGFTDIGMGEAFAAIFGSVLLVLIDALAVVLFVLAWRSNRPFAYISEEPFDLEYGVLDKVKERREAFRRRYATMNIIATGMCFISPLPLILAALLAGGVVVVSMLGFMLAVIAVAVATFIYAGVKWSAMQRLVKEGEFSESQKEKKKLTGSVTRIYWSVAAVFYLALSIVTGAWDTSWIIWPVAALLFIGVNTIAKLVYENKH